MNYYLYDDYDISEDEEDYFTPDMEENFRAQSFSDTLQRCVLPSVTQVTGYILVLVGFSLLCRIVWSLIKFNIQKSEWLMHLTSIACGFAVLYFTIGNEFLIVVLLNLTTYICLLVLEYYCCRNIGIVVIIATTGMQFLYELTWNNPDSWQKIRGVQMIASMKIVSIAFDFEPGEPKKTFRAPALAPYMGYMFCPATCVLGPWVPFNVYISSLKITPVGITWLLRAVFNAIFAVIFLCLSNCIVPTIFSDWSWLWLLTYKDALSVRCSHYFICFLSQAAFNANGQYHNESSSINNLFGDMITRPWLIEFPRSLSSLVRSWNIPMHIWLKRYIYYGLHKYFGSYFVALIGTYIVSSILHGFHLRIYAVLLSLGTFAYIESILRSKVASVFDACVDANGCQKPCQYSNCPSHGLRNGSALIVIMVNALFSFLTIVHLAYLGGLISDAQLNENDDSFFKATGIERWSKLNYFGHWIALVTFAFYYLM